MTEAEPTNSRTGSSKSGGRGRGRGGSSRGGRSYGSSKGGGRGGGGRHGGGRGRGSRNSGGGRGKRNGGGQGERDEENRQRVGNDCESNNTNMNDNNNNAHPPITGQLAANQGSGENVKPSHGSSANHASQSSNFVGEGGGRGRGRGGRGGGRGGNNHGRGRGRGGRGGRGRGTTRGSGSGRGRFASSSRRNQNGSSTNATSTHNENGTDADDSETGVFTSKLDTPLFCEIGNNGNTNINADEHIMCNLVESVATLDFGSNNPLTQNENVKDEQNSQRGNTYNGNGGHGANSGGIERDQIQLTTKTDEKLYNSYQDVPNKEVIHLGQRSNNGDSTPVNDDGDDKDNHSRHSTRGNKKGKGKGHNREKEILKRGANHSPSRHQPHHGTNDENESNQNQSHHHQSNNDQTITSGHDILGIPVNTGPPPGRVNSSNSLSKEISESQMPRVDSVASISMMSEKSEKDAKAGSVGVIDLLKNKKSAPSKKKDKREAKKKKSKQPKSKKEKGQKQQQQQQQNDEIAKRRAAKHFNSAVRKCVERSDPDGLYDLLHDKRNHKYALDAEVLEIVLKAFVVAAMFDEALYCCRNCTKPGTMSTWQTEKILQCLPQNLRNSSAYVAADMINALCIATDFDKPTHRTYFMRIVRGIALEFLEEATSARDRICSAPCERLVRTAVCIVDAQLRRGKKAADLIVIPGKQLGVFVPDSMETRGIQAGDAVGILPYAGPYPMSAESLDRNMIEATVTGVHPMVLRLQDKTNANLYATLTEPVDGNVYRIDKLANRMGFNRQLSAAVAIASPLEKDMNGVAVSRSDMRRPSPELIKAITAMDENIDRVMINGDISRKQSHSTELTSTAALCAQPVPFYTAEDSVYNYDGEIKKQDQYDEDSIRDAARLALQKYGAFEGLNASQRLAVEGAATNRLTLVQGPPGTGKTAVAIRIIQHWARLAASEVFPGQNPKPILATSDSNIAVDNLVEGCANVGLKVIRLGRPEAIRPELLKYCIDRPQNNRTQRNGDAYGYGSNQNNYLSIYKEKLNALKGAQVICCTCIGSGADILDNMSFERVLVDEATQATEPAVLVPLTRLCRQLVLVGDHCQLPPTVLSTRAEEEGLGVPLFSRMVACGVPPFMLDTQYRMHPSIAMFPSDLFYGGKLLNGVSPPERRPLAGFPWPREEFPVAFVPVPLGVEIDDGVSKMNEAEAAAACDAVEALLKGGQCSTSDIAVVTPYAAQVRLIRRLTRKLVNSPPYVEVSSTDGFQGREKEAVVFSAVRSNDYGSVGFVSDWRRVNVSFTRARRGLIVIGNDVTLRRGDPETWMPWLEWVNAHGVNMDKPGKTRGRYDPEQLRRVRGGTTAAEMLKDVLERQQMQLQKAEKQIKNAQKKSSSQIIGANDEANNESKDDHTGKMSRNASELSLKNDLALLSNADGHWDDSDEDECNEIQNSVSVATLTSMTSSVTTKVDEPQDAWDLE